jgi:hypothetical protein
LGLIPETLDGVTITPPYTVNVTNNFSLPLNISLLEVSGSTQQTTDIYNANNHIFPAGSYKSIVTQIASPGAGLQGKTLVSTGALLQYSFIAGASGAPGQLSIIIPTNGFLVL